MSGAAQAGGAAAADERLSQIVALARRLAEAVERERALFQARRPRELEAVLVEKEALADAYAREMRILAREREWVEAASPAMRDTLRETLGGLRALLADYAGAIVARRAVVEGLVRALGQEVARQRQPMTAYGAAGGGAAARPTAIAFDQNA